MVVENFMQEAIALSIKNVTEWDNLMIINTSGIIIRMEVDDMRVMGRATQGVRLINIKGKDSIAAVTKVLREEEEEVIEGGVGDEENGTDIDSSEETETQE